jgi:hypothetical protein
LEANLPSVGNYDVADALADRRATRFELGHHTLVGSARFDQLRGGA